MGFVLNRRTQLSFHELIQDLSIEASIPDRRVLWGGPISKNSGFIIYEHEPSKPLDEGLTISESISISPSKWLLERSAAGEMPGNFDLLLGYIGFKPGQLEEELSKGRYVHMPFFPEIALNVPISERFQKAFESLGHTSMSFMNVQGGAQA